jgi:hypothetical protein
MRTAAISSGVMRLRRACEPLAKPLLPEAKYPLAHADPIRELLVRSHSLESRYVRGEPAEALPGDDGFLISLQRSGAKPVSILTTTASPWPCRAAYFSAAVFIAASCSVNLIFGIGKGSDTATSAVWGAVSVAASIIFALSYPALIRAAGNRSLSGAAVALVAMLLSGTYSISAALGSAGAGRMDAAATETATNGDRNERRRRMTPPRPS